MSFTSEEYRQAEDILREQTFQSCRVHHPPHRPDPTCDWRITPEVLDEMPLLSFLVGSATGMGGRPMFAMRLVKPNDPTPYPRDAMTRGKRLLYYFWRHHHDSGPQSVKKLGMASKVKKWKWVIRPVEPGYDVLEAFKVACDLRVGKEMRPTLLYQALKIDPRPLQ